MSQKHLFLYGIFYFVLAAFTAGSDLNIGSAVPLMAADGGWFPFSPTRYDDDGAYDAQSARTRSAQLTQYLRDNRSIRPVAAEETLTWTPDEEFQNFTVEEDSLTPDETPSLEPLPPSRPQTGIQGPSTIQELNSRKIETLPNEAVQAKKSKTEVKKSKKTEESEGQNSQEPRSIQEEFPDPDAVTDIENRLGEGNVSSAKTTANMPQSPRSGSSLPISKTQIDRFGNIGQVSSPYGGGRAADGTVLNNPYSSGCFEYSPMMFGMTPKAESTRPYPPQGSFGEDGYGNDLPGPGCCGCYGCCGCFYYLWSLLYPALQDSEISAGVFASQDPLTAADNASFGVDGAFNYVLPKPIFGLGYQGGGRFLRGGERNEKRVSQRLDGELPYDDSRSQIFWTTGLFYRPQYQGWQFGAVYDSLRDNTNWKYTLGQIRAELAYKCSPATEIGFRGAYHLDEKTVNFLWDNKDYSSEFSLESYYTGFLRKNFVTGASGAIYGGVTENEKGLVSAELEIPITNHSTIRNNFLYVFPKDKGEKDYLANSWNASISWVLYLGGSSHEGLANPLKPLFNVADNGSMIQTAKVPK